MRGGGRGMNCNMLDSNAMEAVHNVPCLYGFSL